MLADDRVTVKMNGVVPALPSSCDTLLIEIVSGATVRSPLAVLLASVKSPANLAPTTPVNVPTLNPARLTPVRVATPLALVVAVPTDVTRLPRSG